MIITGYIIGLCSLFIVTYRTLIAFFSESKAVIIYVNRFGEQFIDIFAIFVVWLICLVGLFYLLKYGKKEELSKENLLDFKKNPLKDQNIADCDIKESANFEIK